MSSCRKLEKEEEVCIFIAAKLNLGCICITSGRPHLKRGHESAVYQGVMDNMKMHSALLSQVMLALMASKSIV